MRTISSITYRLFKHTPSTAFSSTHGHQDKHVEQVVAVTKHNPLAEKDLRGFENLDKLNENEKSYSPIHTTNADSFALYSIFSFLPYHSTHLAMLSPEGSDSSLPIQSRRSQVIVCTSPRLLRMEWPSTIALKRLIPTSQSTRY